MSSPKASKKKLLCVNCRRIKRKCDGAQPCLSCTKRLVPCEFSQTDRRSQRFSAGYIKSLETNNVVLERTLALLVLMRLDPDGLAAKLEDLRLSFPSPPDSDESDHSLGDLDADDFVPDDTHALEHRLDGARYYGPGTVYDRPDLPSEPQEPLLVAKYNDSGLPLPRMPSLDDDFDFVSNLVHHYMRRQYPGTFHNLFDAQMVLRELDARNFDGPYLSRDLVYAICANCELLLYNEAEAYCEMVLDNLFSNTVELSIAVSQCYTLLMVHMISRGQISKAWLFAGIAIRIGLDVGFDMLPGKTPCSVSNRCYMATMIIDTYLCMSVGRRLSLQQNNIPVLRLPGESEFDFLSMKYSVDLIEMTRYMVRATYQPVTFDANPRINYLVKFNRSKNYNVRMLKWRQALDPVCSWSPSLMKALLTLATENHSLKFLYYYLLIFLNKPFLHVPKQYSTNYLFEEMSKEVVLIVQAKLDQLEGADVDHASFPEFKKFSEDDKYHSASMDLCVVMLLSNVLITLITNQPDHYMYLSKHFKLYVRFLNHFSMRKYNLTENPMEKLLKTFSEFKAKLKPSSQSSPDGSPDNVQKDSSELFSDKGSGCSPQTSDGQFSDHREFQDEQQETKSPTTHQVKLEQTSPAAQYVPVDAPLQPPEMMNGIAPQWQDYQAMANAQAVPVQQAFYPEQGAYAQHYHYAPEAQNVAYTDISTNMPQYNLRPTPVEFGQERMGTFAPEQQPFYSYDHMPKSQDPVDLMMNQLFSNSGQEFEMDRTQFNWEHLFKGHYRELPQ